jgi:hypothetical protein
MPLVSEVREQLLALNMKHAAEALSELMEKSQKEEWSSLIQFICSLENCFAVSAAPPIPAISRSAGAGTNIKPISITA